MSGNELASPVHVYGRVGGVLGPLVGGVASRVGAEEGIGYERGDLLLAKCQTASHSLLQQGHRL